MYLERDIVNLSKSDLHKTWSSRIYVLHVATGSSKILLSILVNVYRKRFLFPKIETYITITNYTQLSFIQKIRIHWKWQLYLFVFFFFFHEDTIWKLWTSRVLSYFSRTSSLCNEATENSKESLQFRFEYKFEKFQTFSEIRK